MYVAVVFDRVVRREDDDMTATRGTLGDKLLPTTSSCLVAMVK